jgi:hypothetical protein
MGLVQRRNTDADQYLGSTLPQLQLHLIRSGPRGLFGGAHKRIGFNLLYKK